MTSISRSNTGHQSFPTAGGASPISVVSVPVSAVSPVVEPDRRRVVLPEAALRVSASAHAAGGQAGLDLTSPIPVPRAEDPNAGDPHAEGLRFLGAGWAADAAMFARYRRRAH